jgi:glycosyltransferase involved in cell wall biosynthesis
MQTPGPSDSRAITGKEPAVAVLIPCYNEASAIAEVVAGFRKALPGAAIYVYDNNSTDDTARVAAGAGAVVRTEAQQGKGYVVRRMFADVDADVYVLVDGDATYHAASVPGLVRTLVDGPLDMVNGARVSDAGLRHRPGHRFGNRLLSGLVAWVFGDRFRDMLSGFKVFSRRYVKSFPALSAGFEIETELTVHALELGMPVAEVDTPYSERAEGTQSKLNTFTDGFRILKTIGVFIKEERPLQFFSLLAGVFALSSVLLAWPVVMTFLETGLVPRFPTAILATGLMLIGGLSFTAGLILDTVTRGRREAKRMRYLSIQPFVEDAGPE